MEPLRWQCVPGGVRGGLKEVSPLPLCSITAAASLPLHNFPTHIFLSPFPSSPQISRDYSQMTSHEGADVSQYGGWVDRADSDDSASGCGVVTARCCTTDCNVEVLTVAVVNRRVATCNMLHTSTNFSKFLRVTLIS
jgi:hypothetical protein